MDSWWTANAFCTPIKHRQHLQFPLLQDLDCNMPQNTRGPIALLFDMLQLPEAIRGSLALVYLEKIPAALLCDLRPEVCR